MKDNINIEEIMCELRKEIEENKLVDDSYEFKIEDRIEFIPPIFKIQALKEEVQLANENKFIDFDVEISSNIIKKYIKTCIRKLIRFQLKPMVENQNLYNINIVNTINLLYSYILENEKKMNRMSKSINKLMDISENLEKKYTELQQKVEGIK